MKYIFLAIFVLFAAQPFQASFCDMHESQEMSHNGHDMQGDHMMEDDAPAMDCCDHDESESPEGCDSMSHCGACTPAVLAINISALVALSPFDSRQYFSDTTGHLNNYSPPPFKPPIS